MECGSLPPVSQGIQFLREARGTSLATFRRHLGRTPTWRPKSATPQTMSWAALPNRGICALTRSRERAPASLSNPCCAARVVGRGVSVPSRVFHTRTRPHQFATFACAARPQESNARRLSDERGPGARLSLTGPLDIAWPPARYVPPSRAHPRILLHTLRFTLPHPDLATQPSPPCGHEASCGCDTRWTLVK